MRGGAFLSDFLARPVAVVAALTLAGFLIAAVAPGLVAPYPVFDLATIDLLDAFIPPSWTEGGDPRFLLGTDDQGRDMVSALVYGLRVSLMVSVGGVALALAIGVTLGLVAGYAGGWTDVVIMRAADVQLTFPAILIAALIDGLFRASAAQGGAAISAEAVLIVAIGLSGWVQYARPVRGAAMVERERDYVAAARLIGVRAPRIVVAHILPNVTTSVLVLATIHLAVAIIIEATLSFVGLGVPATQPSLGTLIRIGNGFLLSGEWWIALLPGLTLVALVLCINLLGDFLRDALNPRLQ